MGTLLRASDGSIGEARIRGYAITYATLLYSYDIYDQNLHFSLKTTAIPKENVNIPI